MNDASRCRAVHFLHEGGVVEHGSTRAFAGCPGRSSRRQAQKGQEVDAKNTKLMSERQRDKKISKKNRKSAYSHKS